VAPVPAAEPSDDNTRLHVGHLTRNVTDAHIREIFGTFGSLRGVDLAIDKMVNLPRCGWLAGNALLLGPQGMAWGFAASACSVSLGARLM
jgi:RNA recognition motif-containing protein